MKTILWLVFFLLTGFSTGAQSENDALAAIKKSNLKVAPNTTRAVIVGISDYQDLTIPDLRFADRDAGAFAEWLQSPAGGSIPDDYIRLLTNKAATKAAIVLALYDLLDSCRAGDLAVFYFSGHGDVENKLRALQPGFLLAYDSPPKVYATNSVDLTTLSQVVTQMAADQVRILLITDACHAGKLAGSMVGGTQATALALQQQFDNAAKIMSCQPDETSLEGEEWGGGRGIFSWHLVDGLTGLADRDEDGIVTLFEAGRYLEDNVMVEAAPHKQMPLIAGDRGFPLAKVDANSLAALQQRKAAEASALHSTVSRGIEEEVLARADSLNRARYHAFQRALKGADLLSDADTSANTLFMHLMTAEVLQPLQGIMRRNFAVALQDEVQQALNALLTDDPYERNNWFFYPDKYSQYPAYLARAMEVLGEGHHMNPSLLAKQRYFEGYNLASSQAARSNDLFVRDSVKALAKAKYLESTALEPGAPYVYYAIGTLFIGRGLVWLDSMTSWFEKALALAPTWMTPCLEAAYEYETIQADQSKVEAWFNRALAVNPESYVVQERLAWLYQWENRTEASLAVCEKMKLDRPDLFNAWSAAGVTRLMRKEYVEAEKEFLYALEMNPSVNNWAMEYLLRLLLQTRRYREAAILTERMLQDPEAAMDTKSLVINHNLLYCIEKEDFGQTAYWMEQLEHLNLSGDGLFNTKLRKAVLTFLHDDPVKGRALYQDLRTEYPGNFLGYQLIWNMYEGIHASKTGLHALADSFFLAALSMPVYPALHDRTYSISANARFHYGQHLLRTKHPAEARAQFDWLLRNEPNAYQGYYGHALLAAYGKRHNEALDYLEQALDRWCPFPRLILEEPLFHKIHKNHRFRDLMVKHFPDTPIRSD